MKSIASYQSELYSAQHLFKSATPSNLSIITGATLACAYFYPETHNWILSWLAIVLLVCCARIYLTQRFFDDMRLSFRARKISQWLHHYSLLTLALSLCSISLVLFLPPQMSIFDTCVLYIVFFAMLAGAIITLPIAPAAFFALTAPIITGLLLYGYFVSSEISLILSIITIIYSTFIVLAGRLMNKRYNETVDLMVENEELIDKLHDEIIQKQLAQQELENNQHILEDTVKIRTKELADINDALLNEINERRRIEQSFKHMAHHDALTNLPNRLLLDARLNHAIDRAKRNNTQVAVMFIDLDHFKDINDSLGHDIGDKLLISVSKRLQHCVREDDTVARLGGDEFIIIIEQVHDVANLYPLLKKIMRVSSETIAINEHNLSTSASIGISLFPDDGTNAEQLMRNADSAMYHAKENGRRKYHFYTRELTTTAYDRVILETDLKEAIEKDQLVVYFQPQVSLFSKKIIGAEALVRWEHPELGLLPPQQFLYIAEHNGLINDIGEKVLTTACEQMVIWKQQGLPIKTVSVNIAGNQIHHGDLVSTVKKTLEKTGCKIDWLELEITEDFIVKKTKQAITTLKQLRELGLSLAIDDFGTGYSSLSYLKQLPINKLKIDRSFIKDLNHEAESAALVQAIIAMGKSLSLELIAEGVENGSHESFLNEHGCEYAQGYLYSKPVTATALKELLILEQSNTDEASPGISHAH